MTSIPFEHRPTTSVPLCTCQVSANLCQLRSLGSAVDSQWGGSHRVQGVSWPPPHFFEDAVHMRRLTPTFCQLFRLWPPLFDTLRRLCSGVSCCAPASQRDILLTIYWFIHSGRSLHDNTFILFVVVRRRCKMHMTSEDVFVGNSYSRLWV